MLDYINMDAAWREQTHAWSVSDPDAEGHDALDVAVTISSAACAGRSVRADLGASRRFAFRGDLSQFGIGLFTSQASLGSLRLDGNLRQDPTSKQCYLPKDVFAKGNESFPSGKSAAFYKLLVKSHGPIDARTTAAVCAERFGRTRRQCTTSTSCVEPLCCCVASGATCSSQWR